jgi:CheY-like chemotaxis protein
VEDHEDSAAIAARLLRGRGYQVVVAGTIRAALSEAAAQKIDLALCDIGLPDGQGSDLMRELRAKYAMPGIALTGFAMDDDRQASDACFSARLLKPIDFGELCRVVEEVLSRGDLGR